MFSAIISCFLRISCTFSRSLPFVKHKFQYIPVVLVLNLVFFFMTWLFLVITSKSFIAFSIASPLLRSVQTRISCVSFQWSGVTVEACWNIAHQNLIWENILMTSFPRRLLVHGFQVGSPMTYGGMTRCFQKVVLRSCCSKPRVIEDNFKLGLHEQHRTKIYYCDASGWSLFNLRWIHGATQAYYVL